MDSDSTSDEDDILVNFEQQDTEVTFKPQGRQLTQDNARQDRKERRRCVTAATTEESGLFIANGVQSTTGNRLMKGSPRSSVKFEDLRHTAV